MTFSEQRLNLAPRWFTGKEWADGTAELELQNEYRSAVKREQAVEDAKTPAQKAKDLADRKKKHFQKWFEWKLSQEK